MNSYSGIAPSLAYLSTRPSLLDTEFIWRAVSCRLEPLIQFLLGHVSVQTTEKYLGCKQRLREAVNDKIGIEPSLDGSGHSSCNPINRNLADSRGQAAVTPLKDRPLGRGNCYDSTMPHGAYADFRGTEMIEDGETHMRKSTRWDVLIAFAIALAIFPGGRLWAQNVADDPNWGHKQVAVDPKIYDGYVGRYQLSPNSALSIIREGDHIYAKATGQEVLNFFPRAKKNISRRSAGLRSLS